MSRMLPVSAPEAITLAVAAGKNPPDLSALDGVNIRMATPEQLPRAVRGADALLIWDFSATGVASAVQEQDRLQWIHVSSAGVDHVLTPELRESGITVTNTRGLLDEAIAEYVLGLVLAFAKDLPKTLQLQQKHQWNHRLTGRLAGAKALVVGPGSVGRCVGELLGKVGVAVDAVGRTPRQGDGVFGSVFAQHCLKEVIGNYGYVILTAPLTAETEGMINAPVLEAMDSAARLINVGRGPLIVEEHLITALNQGTIAGAALDVFQHEPLPPTHPLWTTPNTIISPHMAGDFFEWRAAALEIFVRNLRRFRSGTELLNQIDKEAGYVRSSRSPSSVLQEQQKESAS